MSVDGYSAGSNQDLNHPLGVNGPELFEWFFETRIWRRMHGLDGGESGIDNDVASQAFENIGAWILGRNMFGPVRGPWPDESWQGWWGDEPPYHVPVFVLTHNARPSITMKGGTVFHFVNGGIHAALERAKTVAGHATYASVAASRRFGSSCTCDSSMICTSRSDPCFWGRARICSLGSTCGHSATSASEP
jgi:dihydrofolate reductase